MNVEARCPACRGRLSLAVGCRTCGGRGYVDLNGAHVVQQGPSAAACRWVVAACAVWFALTTSLHRLAVDGSKPWVVDALFVVDVVLALLAGDEFLEVRSDVAEHPATPPDVLAALAEDGEARVRQAVARP